MRIQLQLISLLVTRVTWSWVYICPPCSSSLSETWHPHFLRGELRPERLQPGRQLNISIWLPLSLISLSSEEDKDRIFLISWMKIVKSMAPHCKGSLCGGLWRRRRGLLSRWVLSFPCSGREGQRFCSAPQLCSPSKPHPGADCGENAYTEGDSLGSCCKGMVGLGRPFQ